MIRQAQKLKKTETMKNLHLEIFDSVSKIDQVKETYIKICVTLT